MHNLFLKHKKERIKNSHLHSWLERIRSTIPEDSKSFRTLSKLLLLCLLHLRAKSLSKLIELLKNMDIGKENKKGSVLLEQLDDLPVLSA